MWRLYAWAACSHRLGIFFFFYKNAYDKQSIRQVHVRGIDIWNFHMNRPGTPQVWSFDTVEHSMLLSRLSTSVGIPRNSTWVVCVIAIGTFSACFARWQVFGISTIKSKSSSRFMFRAVTVYRYMQANCLKLSRDTCLAFLLMRTTRSCI